MRQDRYPIRTWIVVQTVTILVKSITGPVPQDHFDRQVIKKQFRQAGKLLTGVVPVEFYRQAWVIIQGLKRSTAFEPDPDILKHLISHLHTPTDIGFGTFF